MFDFFITCPKGLEQQLADEASELGLQSIKQTVGAITASVEEFSSIYAYCLQSRFANRVIWLISEVLSQNLNNHTDLVYKWVYNCLWPRYFSVDKTIAVDFRGKSKVINNSQYGAMLVKDAIVDHFQEREQERPSVNTKAPDVTVFVSLGKKFSRIGLDVSGGSLHKRGYRLQAAKAPLRENLAAALVHKARSFAPEGYLIDPFCGSGTLLIEAVLRDLNIASAIHKPNFGFEQLNNFSVSDFNHLLDEFSEQAKLKLDEAKLKVEQTGQFLAYGYDLDEKSLSAARQNASRAGLEGLISFEQRAFSEFAKPIDQTSLILSNPPFGERLSDRDSLLELYAQIGHAFKEVAQGDKVAILCSDPFLLKNIGLQKSKAIKVHNGTLEAQWVLYHLYKKTHQSSDENQASGLTDNALDTDKDQAQLTMVENRLRKNLKNLKRWVKKNNIHCYRVYDADMPEFAFAVDDYEGRIHVTEYAAPKSVDEFSAFKRQKIFIKALENVFEVDASELAIKERRQQKGKSQYQRVSEQDNSFWVREGNAEFKVNLTDYLDTGLFLDHRPIRLRLAEMAQGKRLLNLFCYTASATVHAALGTGRTGNGKTGNGKTGGAFVSDSVDMSSTYIQWSEDNFKRNKLDLSKHRLHRENVLDWVDKNKLSYDVIFLDPPSFSNSKRMDGTWDVQRDHQALIEKLMRQLEKDGVLIFSNNLRKFKLSQHLMERFQVEDISKQSIDEDFKRHQDIHQCWLIRHK